MELEQSLRPLIRLDLECQVHLYLSWRESAQLGKQLSVAIAAEVIPPRLIRIRIAAEHPAQFTMGKLFRDKPEIGFSIFSMADALNQRDGKD